MASVEHSNSESEDRHSIASLLAPVQIPPDQIGLIRAAQLKSVDKLSVLVVLTNLLNAAIVMVMFSFSGPTGFLGLWGSALCGVCAITFIHSFGKKRRAPRVSRSQHSMYKYVFNSLAFAAVWASLPLILLPHADGFGQMAIGIVLCGLVFGGVLILSRLPAAAYAFAFVVMGGLSISFATMTDFRGDHLAVLAVIYTIVIAVCVRWNYNQFVMQHLNQAAIDQQHALIGLLLRDFEESTSDWLWQTNARGALLDIPLNLNGDKSGYEKMRNGVPLPQIFTPCEARNVLESSLYGKRGFRDLILPLIDTDHEEKWWSLTGKPLIEDGVFMGFRGVASDVTTSKQIEDKIAHMAHYDGLTGLPNRANFQEMFEKFLFGEPRNGCLRVLALLDLDNFKWVNDTLGHAAGDELLRQLARRLTDGTPGEACLARLGGDEFAFFIEVESKGDIDRLFSRLVADLCKPYEIWGSTANCGASIGVRTFTKTDLTPHELMAHADLALYQAKRKGKGMWCPFTPDLDARAKARRLIEADLHLALGREELFLLFQPIVDAETLEVVSCETLMRWDHPTRGKIMPGEFIEHAEDCGLITRMGDWAIREALAQARNLPENVRLSVNISPLQLHSASLVATIVNALAANGISPNRLDLEITESVLLSDTEFVLERLIQLKSLGLSLSLDDFGTGFSSLSYLQSFPFDKIKIDKSFVSDLEENEDSRVITRATISLAKSLGLKCTAEGVETQFQRDFLLAEGCDEIQGFHISRAKTVAQLNEQFGLLQGRGEPLEAIPVPEPRTDLAKLPELPGKPSRRAARLAQRKKG